MERKKLKFLNSFIDRSKGPLFKNKFDSNESRISLSTDQNSPSSSFWTADGGFEGIQAPGQWRFISLQKLFQIKLLRRCLFPQRAPSLMVSFEYSGERHGIE